MKYLLPILSVFFIFSQLHAGGDLEMGENNTFLITDSGDLWGSGRNTSGQLGDGTATDQTEPILLYQGNVQQVASDQQNTLILFNNGSVWGSGENSFGTLGIGTTGVQINPIQSFSSNIMSVAVGAGQGLFLKDNGDLYGSGKNDVGQLGQGNTMNVSSPVLIDTNVQDMVAGFHTLYLKNDGSLWGTGHNTDGQLGQGNTTHFQTPVQIEPSGVIGIGASRAASYFIKSDGSLWAMGYNFSGQLGTGNTITSLVPVQVLSSGVVEVVGGVDHVLVRKGNGSLWAFGAGGSGEIGDGGSVDRNTPVMIESNGVSHIAGGQAMSAYIKNGTMYFMGNNGYGAAGDSAIGASTPTPVKNKFPKLMGPPAKVVISSSSSILGIGQKGSFTVDVKDDYGNRVESDQSTVITFAFTGNGNIFGVQDGFGDGSYGVIGGSENVQVKNGLATIVFSDETVESLLINVTNDGGLVDPPSGNIQIQAAPPLGEVVVGNNFTLVRTPNGAVHGAGDNGVGQLGTSSGGDVNNGRKIFSSGIAKIASAFSTSYFVKDNGSLWATGEGGNGEIGDGASISRTSPTLVDGSGVVDVDGGQYFAHYVKSDGSLWGMGYNAFGQLGDGTTASRSSTTQILSANVITVSNGDDFSVILMADGSAWATGQGVSGQLGDGSASALSNYVQVSGMSANVTQIATGSQHAVFLKADGSVWATGFNSSGQLGDGTMTQRNTPVMVFGGNVDAIFAGQNTTFFLKNDGSLWATGEGVNGEFGDGSSADVQTPVQVESSGVESVATYSQVTLFLMTDGSVKGSGHEQNGELAIGNSGPITINPKVLTGFPEGSTEIPTSESYTLSMSALRFHPLQGATLTLEVLDVNGDPILEENTLEFSLSIGGNGYVSSVFVGQGDGSYDVAGGTEIVTVRSGRLSVLIANDVVETFSVSISNNRGVPGPASTTLMVDPNVSSPKVEAGRNSTFLLSNDGSLRGSGQNMDGQLGDGSVTDRYDPVLIEAAGVLDVSSGYAHTIFLKSDGSAWSMGQNTFGQLGDGGGPSRNTPYQVFSNNIIAVAAGQYHSLFLKENGELWGVGQNGGGQLADNGLADQATPILVSANVTMMAAGSHTLMVMNDGSLWSFGENTSGQLGDGSVASTATPQLIESSGVIRVVAGPNHSFYIKEDGSLWGMGENSNGQLGDGTNSNRNTPIEIFADGVIDMAAGQNHSLVLKSNGSLWSVGYNFQGQLGDGSTTSRSSFYQVELNGVTDVSAGEQFSVYIKNGEMYFMGTSSFGELGDSSQSGPFYTSVTNKFPQLIGDAVELKVASAPSVLGLGQQGTVVVEVIDQYGNVVESDDSTMVTFNLSGSGNIFGVKDGFGDGSYGIPGGSEVVQVIGGRASVVLSDDVIETFSLSFANDGALFNPSPISIDVQGTPPKGQVLVGENFTLIRTPNGAVHGAGDNNYGQLATTPPASVINERQIFNGGIARIGVGSYTSYFIKDNSSLWAVGRGSDGQIGDGASLDYSAPVEIESSDVVDVDGGTNFAHYVKSDGSLWAMGYNFEGQLGDGSTTSRTTKLQVLGSNVIAVSDGDSFSVILKDDGSAWATGMGSSGQIGDGAMTNRSSYVPVAGMSANVIQVSAGSQHAVFLKSDGSVWATGYNFYGQLGDGSTTQQNSPVQVFGGNIVEVFAGQNQTFYLKNDGTLWASGQSVNGEFGDGSSADIQTPTQIASPGIVSVASYSNFTLFLLSDGSIKGSGQEDLGELGVGNSAPLVHNPRVSSGFPQGTTEVPVADHYELSVSALRFHPLQGTTITLEVVDGNGDIILEENTLEFTFSVNSNGAITQVVSGQGDGSYDVIGGSETVTARGGRAAIRISNGQLETFTVSYSNNRGVSGPLTTTLIVDPTVSTPKVAAGRATSFLVSTDGALRGSGQNTDGQLGDGSISDRYDPVVIETSGVLDVSSGYSHTIYVKNDGSAWASGYNLNGQLGDGTTTSRQNPVQVFSSNIVGVAAGQYHSLFLKDNGELWGAGQNGGGQLADAGLTDQPTPILVAANVSMMAAGSHTLIVKLDGSLWSFGENTSGQLGNGSVAGTHIPQLIESSGVIHVAAGPTHSFYIKDDGSLWGMGENSNYQLGDGTINNRPTPIEIFSEGVVDVAAGQNHSLVLKGDGSLWSVGYNLNGQLGDGTTSTRSAFFEVESEGVVDVAAGEQFSIYLKNGRMYFMGSNSFGQFGDSSQAGPFYSPTTNKFPQLVGDAVELVVSSAPAALGIGQQGTVVVEVHDQYGNRVVTDDTTVVTFNLGGSGNVFGVKDGFGDGSYGAPGGTEMVQVISGRASIVFTDGVIETLSMSFSNDGGLLDPAGINIEIQGTPPIGQVLVGENFTLVRTPNGEVHGAGDNNYGQLGTSPVPTIENGRQIFPNGITRIGVGSYTSYFIKDNGSLWAVGRGMDGQIGDGASADYSSPVEVDSSDVIDVDGGTNFAHYVKADGSLWAMGYNFEGQLGDGTTTSRSTKLQVMGSNVIAVSDGDNFSLILKDDGSAWATGAGGFGQIGDGAITNRSSYVPVPGMSANVLKVSAGGSHSVFLKADGSVWATGYNMYGQLGDGSTTQQNTPVQIFGGNIVDIFAGQNQTFFLKSDGSLWATGQGTNGEFGDGSSADYSTPTQVSSSGVDSVASYSQLTLYLLSDGSIKASGQEQSGELGIGTTTPMNYSTSVATGFPDSSTVTPTADVYELSVAALRFHPLQGTALTLEVLDANGDLISEESTLEFTLSVNSNGYISQVIAGQGDGDYGTVGGSETVTVRGGRVSVIVSNDVVESFSVTYSNNRGVPGPVSTTLMVDPSVAMPKVEAGRGSSFLLSGDGALRGAGLNMDGQLGDGSTTDRYDPVVIEASGVLDVSSGYGHTLYLKSDGSAWSIGQNTFGQLGDGGGPSRSTPYQVFSSNIVAVAAGEYHSLFLKENGELWGVGQNSSGQLADSGLTDQSTPILVAANVSMMAAGSHTLIVKLDGSLLSFGENMSGQLGNGSTTSTATPQLIESSDVIHVAAGPSYSFYIKSDGSLWAMGENSNNQLGDGTATNRSSPVQIFSEGVVDMAGGQNHSLVIKNDGSLWSIGYNFYGQLGDGSTSSRSTFYQVESSGVTDVSAGEQYSIFLKNGEMFFMGGNPNGQIGDASQPGPFYTPTTNKFPQLVGDAVELVVASAPSVLGLGQQGTVLVEVIDQYGNRVVTDDSTVVTFNLSGSGNVFGVKDGFGDGSYGVPAGSESVQVKSGRASIVLVDHVLETLNISFSNDGGLFDPSGVAIEIQSTPPMGQVVVGENFTLIRTANGSVHGAGTNNDGQLATTPVASIENGREIFSAGIKSIGVGSYTSYFIKDNGSLWAVGRGMDGQIGDGASASYSNPVEVESSDVVQVEGGDQFAHYVKSDGSLWGMGYNFFGQLGDGTTTTRSTKVQVLSGNVDYVSNGHSFSVILKDDGSAWATGQGSFGQIGDNGSVDRNSYVPVNGMSANVLQISTGREHAVFLMNDGSVWATGRNMEGQLGDGTTTQKNIPVQVFSANIQAIFAGDYTTFFLKIDGSLWATGQGISGQFGDGSSSDVSTPVQVAPSGVVAVDTYSGITLFLMNDGSVMGSGYEEQGELAIGTTTFTNHYTRIPTGFPSSEAFVPTAVSYSVETSVENFHPLQSAVVTIRVLDGSGNLISLENTLEINLGLSGNGYIDQVISGQGDGSYGVVAGSEVVTVRGGMASVRIGAVSPGSFNLSVSNNRSVSGPSLLVLTADPMSTVPSIEAGRHFNFIVTSDGTLWGTGRNNNGQLGDGASLDRTDPVELFSDNILDVSGGQNHTVFLMRDGSAWTTGYNFHGQIGDGTTVTRYAPVQVFSGNIIAVEAGLNHTLFLKDNGELWGTGQNDSGQLADSGLADQLSPILVSANVMAMAAGGHTLIIKNDGSLWSFGQNATGQLGNGNNSSTATPQLIESSGVTSVSASMDFGHYIKSDGSLWGMGYNIYGQLGDGTGTDRNLPVEILSSGVVQVESGYNHTLIIKDDGSLWAFGQGTSGQLGDGTSLDRSLPVQIEPMGVTDIGAGENFSIFVKDGLVYLMGDNSYGQLGDSSQGIGPYSSPISSGLPSVDGPILPWLVVEDPMFVPSGNLERGGSLTPALAWKVLGGTNVEIWQSFEIGVTGNVFDIASAQVVNVSQGNSIVFSGSPGAGNVMGGNLYFNTSIALPTEVDEIYELRLAISSMTDLNDITLDIHPGSFGLLGGNTFGGNVVNSGTIPFVTPPAGPSMPLALNPTAFVAPANLLTGGMDMPVLEWEFSGGANLEVVDSLNLDVYGDATDLVEVRIVDLGSGNAVVYDGNVFTGNVFAGNLRFDQPFAVPAMTNVALQLRVDLKETPSGNDIAFAIFPGDQALAGGNAVVGGNAASGVIPYAMPPMAPPSPSLPLSLDGTGFVAPANLLTGGMDMPVMRWQLSGGANLEVIDSLNIEVFGDVNDLVEVRIVDLGSGNAIVFGGNALTGNVVAGNLRFDDPFAVPAMTNVVLEMRVDLTESPSGNFIDLVIHPEDQVLAGGNMAVGSGSGSGVIPFVTPPMAPPSPSFPLSLDGTGFVAPANLLTGGMDMPVLQWEFRGGANVELIDSLYIQVLGDVNDLAKVSIVDVSMGNALVYSGNASTGNVVLGDLRFDQPLVVPAMTNVVLEVRVDLVESPLGSLIDLVIQPEDQVLAGGNLVAGSAIGSGAIPYVMPPMGPAPQQPTFHLRSLSAGLGFKAVISGANVWTLGRHQQGELGRGGDPASIEPVPFGDNLIAVSAGETHVLALQGDGQVWSWGTDAYGQGILPALESGISDPVVQIAAGGYTSYALDDQGQLWVKGRNQHGQAGLGNTSDVFVWTQVTVPGNVVDFAAGLDHLLVIVDGDLYGTGSDGFGQLGQASTSLMLIDDSRTYEKVAAGAFHSIALSDLGEVAVWGRNVEGQLGLGTTSSRASFQLISGLTGVTDVAAGRNHTLLLDSVGDVLGMGRGRQNQLPTGIHVTPTMISGWSNVVELGAGPYSSLVLKSDGSIEMRGLNGSQTSGPSVLPLP